MAAITALAMTLRSGEGRVVIPDDVYGGTFRLFDKVTSGLGLEYATVDMSDLEAVEESLAGGAGLVLAESPTNPRLGILDLSALAELAHAAGARFVVDNTFATPYLQRPLRLGADAVVYSATKYLGGHSDLVMGALTLDDGELAARLRFIQGSAGAVPGPFDSWLLLRGLKTLGVRMRQHCENAGQVARVLEEHPAVTRVHYPGLERFPGHELAARQMDAAGTPLYGGMVSFETESEELALRVCERTRLFFLGESLGGVESLIEHPARMTHASLAGSGIEVPGTLVRLSVGLEHPEDLIADLEQALE
jgi:cystathionine gamma-synthase